jgi:hypothetical protein
MIGTLSLEQAVAALQLSFPGRVLWEVDNNRWLPSLAYDVEGWNGSDKVMFDTGSRGSRTVGGEYVGSAERSPKTELAPYDGTEVVPC